MLEIGRKRGSRGSITGLHPAGFAEDSTSAAPKPQPRKSYSVVEVFYATDREKIPPTSSSGRVQFRNRRFWRPQMEYGVCSVTVPKDHDPGKMESPSFWRFEFTADPEKHFTISGCISVDEKVFFGELNSRVSQSIERSCFVFIHGFNVAFDAAALCTAQLATDMKFLGTPILYSWTSADKPLSYEEDEKTNKDTWNSFRKFLSDVASSSSATRIHLIAHSMGNRALLDALVLFATDPTAPTFDQVVMAAPDVPRQNVEPLIASARLKSSRLTLYATRADIPLRLSSLKNSDQRLGKIYGKVPALLPGVDTIDASKFKGDFWGHSGFSKAREVVDDIMHLLSGAPPEKRFGLQTVDISDTEKYWVLR